jgi:hypothetical protein
MKLIWKYFLKNCVFSIFPLIISIFGLIEKTRRKENYRNELMNLVSEIFFLPYFCSFKINTRLEYMLTYTTFVPNYKITLRKLQRLRKWILILSSLTIDMVFTILSYKNEKEKPKEIFIYSNWSSTFFSKSKIK